jgi:hypothetical protein
MDQKAVQAIVLPQMHL